MPALDLQGQVELVARLALAGLLGALVGWEREAHRRPAGLRTYTLVAVGACLFTLLSIYAFPGSDPARIAAQIVTGIGFIGAGTIIRSQGGVRGVTTAAGIWAIAAVGMAAGAGLYVLALVTAAGAYAVLQFVRVKGEAQQDERERGEPPDD